MGNRIRYRLLRRFRMGLGSVGIRLASSIRGLRPQPVLIPTAPPFTTGTVFTATKARTANVSPRRGGQTLPRRRPGGSRIRRAPRPERSSAPAPSVISGAAEKSGAFRRGEAPVSVAASVGARVGSVAVGSAAAGVDSAAEDMPAAGAARRKSPCGTRTSLNPFGQPVWGIGSRDCLGGGPVRPLPWHRSTGQRTFSSPKRPSNALVAASRK